MSEKLEQIIECVIEGNDDEIIDLIKEALASGISASDIVNKALIGAMDIVGPKMESGEMFIPEVLMAADTMKMGLDELKPLIGEGGIAKAGKVVIGTVEGDLHDIGKNLVAMMLEVSGFEVVDIGVDQSAQNFIDACQKENADIVGLSALLTTTMNAMKDTVALFKSNEEFKNVKLVVGGAPVTADFAKSISADGYADDAGSAVVLCKKILSN